MSPNRVVSGCPYRAQFLLDMVYNARETDICCPPRGNRDTGLHPRGNYLWNTGKRTRGWDRHMRKYPFTRKTGKYPFTREDGSNGEQKTETRKTASSSKWFCWKEKGHTRVSTMG